MNKKELDKKLQDAFQFIRKSFFTKWDKKNEWQARLNLDKPGRGLCNDATKTIEIRSVQTDENDFYTLLVHEICHAVARCNHASKWKIRMSKASDKAIELGLKELGDLIKADVESYRDPKIVTLRDICDQIEDVASEFPNESYENIIKMVAKKNPISSDQLEKSGKRCRKVFDSVKRDQIREENLLRKKRALMEQEISNVKEKDDLLKLRRKMAKND